MADIFLSYASEDRERVRPLVHALESKGWSVWWDRDIEPGASFHRVITDAIAQAKCVIVCWSEHSIASDWVANEANEGKEREILVPVLLDAVRPPLGFRMDHAVMLVGWTSGSSDPEFDALLDAVARHAGGECTSATETGADVVAGAASTGRSTPSALTRSIGFSIFTVTVVVILAVWFIPDLLFDRPADAPTASVPPPEADLTEENSIRAALERPMVAVLPFTNASGDPANDYVSLGVMDEIIVGLQQFKSFPVVSRNATIAFKARSEPVPVIARDLDADYILDGSLRRSGERFRIVATLMDDDGAQVWVRGFDLDADMSGVFPIVDELAATVAAAVQTSEIKRVTSSTRPPISAWEHYVRGLAIILDWQPADHEEGVEHIERALEIAPNMAEAWWGLGELESIRLMTEPPTDPRDAFAAVEGVIGHFRKAHELSAFHAGACGCLGIWLTAIGRDEQARVIFEQALEANPLSGTLRVDYARFLTWQGKYPEAIEMAEVSTRLGTDARDKALAAAVQAVALLATDQPDAARAAVHRALFIKRLEILSTPIAIPVLYVLGDWDDATVLFREFNELFPTYSPSNLASQVDFKQIDKLIARRRNESAGLPEDVSGIFRVLAATAAKLEQHNKIR